MRPSIFSKAFWLRETREQTATGYWWLDPFTEPYWKIAVWRTGRKLDRLMGSHLKGASARKQRRAGRELMREAVRLHESRRQP